MTNIEDIIVETRAAKRLKMAQAAQRKKEKRLYPLRIDEKTTILVRKKDLTEEYKKKFVKKTTNKNHNDDESI